jgi:hypothetical protein
VICPPIFPFHPTMSRAFIQAVGLATALLATPAFASPTPQQIRDAADEFDIALKALRERNYEEAAVHFEKADREAPSPQALQGALRARREGKQAARAATLASQALARYPDRKELAEFARTTIGVFSKDVHRVTLTCKPACVLAADQRLLLAEPATETTVFVDPGAHVIAAGWGSKHATRDIDAKAGGETTLVLQEPVDPPPPPATPVAAAPTPPAVSDAPPPPPASGLPPYVFWGGVAATAALSGVTIWSSIDAQNNPGADTVRERCAGRGAGCPEYQDGLERQRRTNILLATSGGVGVVTAAIGVFLTRWGSAEPAHQSDRAARSTVRAGVALERGGAIFAASGAF